MKEYTKPYTVNSQAKYRALLSALWDLSKPEAPSEEITKEIRYYRRMHEFFAGRFGIVVEEVSGGKVS